VKRGETVGVDGSVLGLAAAAALRSTLTAAGIGLKTDFDVLAEVWPERPGLPGAPVYEHRAPEARSPQRELAEVRAAIKRPRRNPPLRLDGRRHRLAAEPARRRRRLQPGVPRAPADRGRDATLYVDDRKVDAALAAQLARDGVRVAPYADTPGCTAALPADAVLLIDPKRVTLGLREHARVPLVEAINPSTLLKSRKSADEAVHVRAAMVEDGAAMCEFYAWLEAALADPKRTEPITELTIDQHLSAGAARRPASSA
jgi:Xaa-Pro aminopeptidase